MHLPEKAPSDIFPTNSLSKESLTTSLFEESSMMAINPELKMI